MVARVGGTLQEMAGGGRRVQFTVTNDRHDDDDLKAGAGRQETIAVRAGPHPKKDGHGPRVAPKGTSGGT